MWTNGAAPSGPSGKLIIIFCIKRKNLSNILFLFMGITDLFFGVLCITGGYKEELQGRVMKKRTVQFIA